MSLRTLKLDNANVAKLRGIESLFDDAHERILMAFRNVDQAIDSDIAILVQAGIGIERMELQVDTGYQSLDSRETMKRTLCVDGKPVRIYSIKLVGLDG